MGFLTPVLIYNDSMHEISEDKHFGERVAKVSREIYHRNQDNVLTVGYLERKTIISEILRFFGYEQNPVKDNGTLRCRFNVASSSQAAICLKPEHADTPRLLFVWQNSIVDLSAEGTDKGKHSKVPQGRTDKTYMDWLETACEVSKRELKYFEEALKFHKQRDNVGASN